MAMPTAEHRAQLVAGGCDEELADAILGVAVAVRDEAVEAAVARAMEQVAHSAGLLNGRIDSQDTKNEAQFQVIESTIREVASQIRTEIADLETRLEKRLTDFQTETERRFTKLETQMERRFSGLEGRVAKLEGQIAVLRAEADANYARLNSTIHRAAFGLAGLIIAVTGVVVALVATGVLG